MSARSKAQQAAMAAYIAGFLDGEGNITILARNKSKGYRSYGLHVGFTNRDTRPLFFIQDIYGGNLFEKSRKQANHARAFELRVGTRTHTERLLHDVLPYLICKREQAELGLAFLRLGRVKMRVIGRRQIHPTKGGSYPISQAAPGEQERREEMKQRLMLLNKRGA